MFLTVRTMGGVGLLAALLAMPAAGQGADARPLNTLSEKEKAAGWKLLFDGKTTTGWRKYKGKTVPDSWKVVEGTLALIPGSGKSGGDLVTVDQYESFELALEWKISSGGNSGIMYHVVEGPNAPYESGPEYQLLDNARHPDGKNPLTAAASCYALYAPSREVTRPVGQWNHTRLVVKGKHVQHWLNDTKVVEYELGSADWQKRVKASKFKNMPKFGKEPRGYLCLQDHGNRVEFRNIKVRSLDTAKSR